MFVMEFPQKFGFAIEVFRIRGVGFLIVPFLSRKNAIRAELHQAGADVFAKERQAMGEKSVEFDARYGLLGGG